MSNNAVSSTRRLVSASAVMAAGTLVSRTLGLIRVMLIAFILGNGTRQADMLSLATTIPNSLYILFAGGALNTVLVPQIVRAAKDDADGGEAYINRIMTAFLGIVALVAMIATLAAPLITMLYSSGGWREPELAAQYTSLIALTYLTLPQIFFYGAFFLLAQVLNAREKFGPMMWAPIANNVISILVLSTYLVVWGNREDHATAFTAGQVWLLGLGSTLGIACQLLVLLPFLKKVGFKFRPRFDLRGTGLGKTFSLAKWTIGFVLINQIALIIIQRLATSATATGAGAGASVYANAHLLWILPHSLITVSLATAMLPSASRLAAAGDMRGVAAESIRTMRLATLVLVPASVGFIVLANPIAGLFFGQGTGRADANFVAWALVAFAIGLVPFTVQFIVLRTFYALEDTRTPFLLQLLIASLNAGLAFVFVVWIADPTWVAALLALSYSLAYAVGIIVSWRLLRRRLPALNGNELVMHILRLELGALVAGGLAYLVATWLASLFPSSIMGNLIAIVSGLAVLGAIYLLIAKLLRVRELRNVSQLIRERLGGRKNTPEPMVAAAPATAPAPQAAPAVAEAPVASASVAAAAVSASEDSITHEDTLRPAAEVEESNTTVNLAKTLPPTAADAPPQREPEPSLAAAPIAAASSPRSDHDPDAPAIARPGLLLSTRFRLDELLAKRRGIETWQAHDLVLSRDVVLHVMRKGDDRIDHILNTARTGATATEARFLRVLDAIRIQEPGHEVGAYVACEYAPGVSLSQLLATGPLSGTEAAWLTREIAEALGRMHTKGLFHEQINPDNILITQSGAVRLVGFGVESAIFPEQTGDLSWSRRESLDVTGLASILYASLVRYWPGEAAWGLPAAPIIAGETAPVHTMSADISPTLDDICQATLTRRGAAAMPRITTAEQLTRALNQVIAGVDASSELEKRVRSLQVGLTDEAPTAIHEPVPAAAPPPLVMPAFADEATAAVTETAESDTESFVFSGRTKPNRIYLYIILAIAVIALVWGLITVSINNALDNAAPPVSPTPSADSGSAALTGGIQVAGVRDFDPEADNGNAEENSNLVGLVIDGDQSTGWKTVRYHNRPNLGGLKPGVGLILDLGEPKQVSSVQVLFAQPGSDVELRIPTDLAAKNPPMTSQKDWTIVASQTDAPADTKLIPSGAVTTRYLLVYLTKLPQVEQARYQTQINEIVVN